MPTLAAGAKFNLLTLISRDSSKAGHGFFRCDCGVLKSLRSSKVFKGEVKSCGCAKSALIRQARTKHGMFGTVVYGIWAGLLQRCKATALDSAYYSDKGIAVCERWRSFENFYSDMGDPSEGQSIDRIDNSKGYEPGNCKWSSSGEQARNRTNNYMVTYKGETKCLAAWCEQLSLNYQTVYKRLRTYGWEVERAFKP